MDDANLSSEDLITEMMPEEVCELLAEMGIEATVEQAASIQDLVREMGSLEAACEAFLDDLGGSERAAA